jgi:hypothetical protein
MLDRRWNVRLARVVGSLAVLGLLTAAVWPRASDAALRDTYASLRSAPVPALLVGSVRPASASAEVTADRYVLAAELPDVGRVTISGQRAGSAQPAQVGSLRVRGYTASLSTASADQTALVWTEPDATYTLAVAGQPGPTTLDALAARVVPLDQAARDAFGFAWDTPLLYAAYLPLFVGFAGWAGARLLAR